MHIHILPARYKNTRQVKKIVFSQLEIDLVVVNGLKTTIIVFFKYR